MSISLFLQVTKFPLLPCQRGQGKFSCVILWGAIPHTNWALRSLETTKVCLSMHDSWFYMETWRGAERQGGDKRKKVRDVFSPGQTAATAAFFPQVPADQLKAQECDFSYDGRAELWALIPDWRESRIFRHSEWRAGEKRLGMEKKAGRLVRQKRLCVCGRRGTRKGREGGNGTTNSYFSTPVFHPPLLNPKSFLSRQLPAKKLFSMRDREDAKG